MVSDTPGRKPRRIDRTQLYTWYAVSSPYLRPPQAFSVLPRATSDLERGAAVHRARPLLPLWACRTPLVVIRKARRPDRNATILCVVSPTPPGVGELQQVGFSLSLHPLGAGAVRPSHWPEGWVRRLSGAPGMKMAATAAVAARHN